MKKKLFQSQTDGGFFGELEVVDRFVRVEKNDVKAFTQSPRPPWCRYRRV